MDMQLIDAMDQGMLHAAWSCDSSSAPCSHQPKADTLCSLARLHAHLLEHAQAHRALAEAPPTSRTIHIDADEKTQAKRAHVQTKPMRTFDDVLVEARFRHAKAYENKKDQYRGHRKKLCSP